MSKLRLLFVKEGTAAYISHLDLLRTVQRAFPRTELEIKHSQGFHPHPIISIVLPLPVAQSSDCELLDFEVTQDTDGGGYRSSKACQRRRFHPQASAEFQASPQAPGAGAGVFAGGYGDGV